MDDVSQCAPKFRAHPLIDEGAQGKQRGDNGCKEDGEQPGARVDLNDLGIVDAYILGFFSKEPAAPDRGAVR